MQEKLEIVFCCHNCLYMPWEKFFQKSLHVRKKNIFTLLLKMGVKKKNPKYVENGYSKLDTSRKFLTITSSILLLQSSRFAMKFFLPWQIEKLRGVEKKKSKSISTSKTSLILLKESLLELCNLKIRRAESPSQSAPTILKNRAPCFLQKADWKKPGYFFIHKEKRLGCLFSFWITMTLVFCTLFFSKSRVPVF